MKWGWSIFTMMFMLVSCAAPGAPPSPTPAATLPPGMTEAQAATLNSIERIDDHPLYTMHFVGSYGAAADVSIASLREAAASPVGATCRLAWGCSLFATLGDGKNRLYGRNFDWEFSPALLLFTDPPDGYASVSMVDIYYLGFGGERSQQILDLSLAERRALLNAPWLPFDGMNEKGLAIGMAAVIRDRMPFDPNLETVDSLGIIREMLDHAATVDEAVQIIGSHNIDMGDVPLHYLIGSAAGDSALVEFRGGEMKVLRNETAWQAATNFVVSAMNGHPEGECPRYDRISRRLTDSDGRLSSQEAFQLLQDVSQDTTQWSIVYQMTSLDLGVVMGTDYAGKTYTFHLE